MTNQHTSVDSGSSGEVAPDAKVTLEGPALAANRFFVVLMPHGVRIAFSEQTSPGLDFQFRSAVILSYDDARALRDVLQRLLNAPEATPAQPTATPDSSEAT